jgi:hypothetical protein
MALEPGTEVGPYRVIEQVGQGGMAMVYKAYQASLSRYVALKVLPPRLAGDPDFQTRFHEEAVRVAALRHPNILTVIDYGEADGITYIVSEFVDGGTLAAQMGTPLPVSYVLEVLGPISSALDYAHSRSVIHRDVKPSNILLALDGRPLLTDFGIARMVIPEQDQSDASSLVGTPTYMAPEQGSGRPTAASDIYSTAVVAYEMLTGRPPFEAYTPMAVILAHQNEPLPLPRSINPEIAPAVEEALIKCLSRNPDARFRTTGAFIRALEHADAGGAVPVVAFTPTPASPPGDPMWVGGGGAPPPPPSPPETGGAGGGGGRVRAGLPDEGAAGGGGRRRWLIIGGLALLVLLLLGGGAYYFFGRNTSSGGGNAFGIGQTKASPSPSPVVHQPLLFAVLEQKSGTGQSSSPQHDTVAIANLNGDAVAKQTFTARSLPNVGPAAPLLQPEARTAAGAVFYADGKGVIRRLAPDGSNTQAGSVTVSNGQQELAFAVSPDGKVIDATVLTLQPVVPASDTNPFSGPGPGPMHLELTQIQVGGASKSLSSKDIPQEPFPAPILQMVGWDSTGAIATANTALGTQNLTFPHWFGQAHHLDNNGNFISSAEFGGTGCNAQQALADATVLCVTDDRSSVSVRNSSAQVQWSLPKLAANSQGYYAALSMSPDGSMVAVGGGATGGPAGIYKKTGATVTFPSNMKNFLPEGWLDADTVIGTNGQGTPMAPDQMWLFRLSSPTKGVDLGFKGNFAGVVQPAT